MKRTRPPEGEILYGPHAVRAALEARRRPVRRLWLLSGPGKGRERREEIRGLADASRVPVAWVSRDSLDRRARTADHQGVVADVAPFPYGEEGAFLARLRASGAPALVLALDSIQDPRNLGAMVRSANVAGAQGVVIPKDRSAVVTAAAAKASAGAVEFTPIVRVTNLVRALRGMKEAGLWVVGAAPDGEVPLVRFDARSSLALVIGGEGRGLRALVRRTCDACVAIPVKGEIGSLNAATAAAVLLCEAARQRER
jgi:23S rRNA (guanosine2251-2'-O)-methyltransferase